MKSITQRRTEAAERQAKYDSLSFKEKMARAVTPKERTKVASRWAAAEKATAQTKQA
jgi:hypothetical protein